MECTLQLTDDVLTAIFSGSMLFSDHGIFKQLMGDIGETTASQIVIELSAVDFIDSSGLGMLLLLRDHCDKLQKKLVLSNPGGQVRKTFHLARFSQLFTIRE